MMDHCETINLYKNPIELNTGKLLIEELSPRTFVQQMMF